MKKGSPEGAPSEGGCPLMAGVSGRHSYRMTLAESETRFCRCPPDIIFPPFLARKGKAPPLLRGAPSGAHGGWSKGFFSSLLRNIFLDSLTAVESRTDEALTALDSPPLAGYLPEFVAAAVPSAGAGL